MAGVPGQLGVRRPQHPGARRRLARGDGLPLVQDGELAARPLEDAEATPLEQVRDEEFTELSKASNNSTRGIWSDGDLMHRVQDSDPSTSA